MKPNNEKHPPSTELAPESAWFKSSYSSQDNGNCLEVADLTNQVGIRDSKDKKGPALLVPTASWVAFITDVQDGRFDAGLVD